MPHHCGTKDPLNVGSVRLSGGQMKIRFLVGASLAACLAATSAGAAVVTLNGTAGSAGAHGDDGGSGESVVGDLGLTTPNGDADNRLTVNGGDGGAGGAQAGTTPPGDGGNGGAATARVGAGEPGLSGVRADGAARGGNGGAAGTITGGSGVARRGDGGDGGDAFVDGRISVGDGGAPASSIINAQGGAGGIGGIDGRGGDGGDAGFAFTVDGSRAPTNSPSAQVLLRLDGGAGGAAQTDGVGGNGGSVIADQSIATADFEGSIALGAVNANGAFAGNGGAASGPLGRGGNGGDAVLKQTFDQDAANSVDVRLSAFAGNGGDAAFGGRGGDAEAEAVAINNAAGTANLIASATAGGGDAGEGIGGAAGGASARAVASGVGPQNPNADARAIAGATNARISGGGYDQAAGAAATAFSSATTTNEVAFAVSDARATATGGQLADATSISSATQARGAVVAETRNEGQAAGVSVSTGYNTDNNNAPFIRNDNIVDITAVARAGADATGFQGEDYFASATTQVDPTDFGAAGSVARQLANDAGTAAVGGLTFFASADDASNLQQSYSADYRFTFDRPLSPFDDDAILRLAIGDVVSSGGGFDQLRLTIDADLATILDVTFNSVTEFEAFFEDGIFQIGVGNIASNNNSFDFLEISLDYLATSSSSAAGLSLSSLTAATIAGTAFGFELFAGVGDTIFTAMTGGGGMPPGEIPLPGAFWLMAAGLGLFARRRRCTAAFLSNHQ